MYLISFHSIVIIEKSKLLHCTARATLQNADNWFAPLPTNNYRNMKCMVFSLLRFNPQ
jgi:hypothetical protein